MPVPVLNITDAASGTPRHAVPLRYALLVADWTVEDMLSALLASPLEHLILTAYQYRPGQTPIEIRASEFRKLRNNPTIKKDIKFFPVDYFVWSDGLAWAFSENIFQIVGVETAQEEGLSLFWYPALKGADLRAVEQCVDLSPLQPQQQRPLTPGQKARKIRNEKFCQEKERLLQHAKAKGLAKPNAALIISKNKKLNPPNSTGKILTEKSIRHILQAKCE